VRAAAARIAPYVLRTPIQASATLSRLTGAEILLKCENLQRTGSFKVRGALNRVLALSAAERRRGVVAASAGNHAQGVAYAAAIAGARAVVVMPESAAIAKIEATKAYGAEVVLAGAGYAEAFARATALARRRRATLVHAFDDPAIVAGQGSLGLELLEDVPDLAKVVVPVGGGGLCAGIALVIKEARPDVEIVGVQAAACAPYPESMRRGEPIEAKSVLTIADGIAIKRPGGVPLAILSELLDGMVVVGEDETAAAMALLMERCKLVVEGAGAVSIAALLGGGTKPASDGVTVAVLSGGNIDAGLLAAIARRHETESGRRLVMLTRVSDRPGGLARLLVTVAGTGANLVDVSHVREGLDLHVRETAIELVVETRGRDHADRVLKTLNDEGYPTQVLR
jgi:threonine dehydratase